LGQSDRHPRCLDPELDLHLELDRDIDPDLEPGLPRVPLRLSPGRQAQRLAPPPRAPRARLAAPLPAPSARPEDAPVALARSLGPVRDLAAFVARAAAPPLRLDL